MMGKKQNKLLVASTIFFLLLMSSVIASTPQYRIEYLLENTTVNGDNQDFGEILFIEEPSLSTFYNQSTFSNLFVETSDRMTWLGTQSIEVFNPQNQGTVMVTGSTYFFPTSGVYNAVSLINNSNTFQIIVEQSPKKSFNLSVFSEPKGFDLELDVTDFFLDTQQIVKLTGSVGADIESDDYEYQLKINNDIVTREIEVEPVINWSIDLDSFFEVVTVKTGSDEYLGRIEILNSGNKDFDLSFRKTGNASSFFALPSNQTIFLNTENFFDFTVRVPSNQESGNYTSKIFFSNDEFEEYVNVTVVVLDNIAPFIENITIGTEQLFVDIPFDVIATDNNDVVRVTMNTSSGVVNFEKDGNSFYATRQFSKVGVENLVFCAYDEESNSYCETVVIDFKLQEGINNFSKVVTTPSVKFGKYSVGELFNLPKNVVGGVRIELVNIENSVGTNYTPLIRVSDSRGSIKNFVDNRVTLTDAGNYFLEVKSDQAIDFTGILRLTLNSEYQQYSDITFRSSFKNYDVPQSFVRTLDEGRNVTCTVVDTGDLSDSYFDCNFPMSITTVPEDVSIPTTISERELWRSEKNVVEEELESTRQRVSNIVAFFLVVLVILVGSLYFATKMYPVMRFKFGKKQ